MPKYSEPYSGRFLGLERIELSGQVHAFPPGERTRVNLWIGGNVCRGRNRGVVARRKTYVPTGILTADVQPIGSNRVIPAHNFYICLIKTSI